MSVFEFMATVVTLVIVLTLFISVLALRRIERRLGETEKSPDGSVHDALHPVFSARHLRLARQRFEYHYKTQLRLEKQLHESEAWLSRQERAELSPGLCKDMRQVCEALVEAECSWKEYVFMISGNVSVANQSESGRSIVEGWNTLLKETRGVASKDFVAPNRVKLQRVDEWFENWRARLGNQTANIGSDGQPGIQLIGDELFQDVWEDREEWRAPYR